MARENILEDGIVVESGKGYADIALTGSENCEECTAKIFCKPSESNIKTIRVKDSFGVTPGDEVKITVSGRSVLKATLLLYGVPLLLLVAGIFAGLEFFPVSKYTELFSFLSGIGLIGLYFLAIYLLSKRPFNQDMTPSISFVKKRT